MQNRKGLADVGTFIALLVFSIVGVAVVLGTVSDVVDDVTGTNTATNESRLATNATTVTLANADGNDVVSGSETITNGTGAVTLTRNSNYTINNLDGTITWTNVTNADFGTSALVTYQYRDEAFSSNAPTRSLLDVLPVLMAVAILLVIVAFVFKGQ